MLRPPIRTGLAFAGYDIAETAPERLLGRLSEIAQGAEGAGFDAIFLSDHFQEPVGEDRTSPVLDGPTALAALAARTERAQLGLLTAGVTYRNPALLAKMTTTLDVLSGGRAIFGIGAAWLEAEHAAYGWDFPSLSERFERLEEAVIIARAMFTQEQPSFTGTHYRIDGAANYPRPIRGDIPILIGGNGERKTLRLVARYADACNVSGPADEVRRLLGVLDGHCDDVGRDPAEVLRTSYATIAIGATHDEAERRLRTIPEQMRAGVIAGDPDGVAEQAAALRAAGVGAVIVDVVDVHEPELVELAGRALQAAMA